MTRRRGTTEDFFDKPKARAMKWAWDAVIEAQFRIIAAHYETMEDLKFGDHNDVCMVANFIPATQKERNRVAASVFVDSFFGTEARVDFAIESWKRFARYYNPKDPLHRAPHEAKGAPGYYACTSSQRLVVPMVGRAGGLRIMLGEYHGFYPVRATEGSDQPDIALDKPWPERRELLTKHRGHPAVREFVRCAYQRFERRQESRRHMEFLQDMFSSSQSMHSAFRQVPELRSLLCLMQIPEPMLGPYQGYNNWSPAALRSKYPDWTVRWAAARTWAMKGLTLKTARGDMPWEYTAIDLAMDTATY